MQARSLRRRAARRIRRRRQDDVRSAVRAAIVAGTPFSRRYARSCRPTFSAPLPARPIRTCGGHSYAPGSARIARAGDDGDRRRGRLRRRAVRRQRRGEPGREHEATIGVRAGLRIQRALCTAGGLGLCARRGGAATTVADMRRCGRSVGACRCPSSTFRSCSRRWAARGAELVAAVANARGFGILPCAYLTPGADRRADRGGARGDRPAVRREPVRRDAAVRRDETAVAAAHERLRAAFARNSASRTGGARAAARPLRAQLDAVLEARPDVFTFTFGIPQPTAAAAARGRHLHDGHGDDGRRRRVALEARRRRRRLRAGLRSGRAPRHVPRAGR